MAENVVEILVKSKDKTKAGNDAAVASAEATASRVQAIWEKHSDTINKKLANLGSGLGKGGGLLAIGSAALAMAGPLGAATAAVGAFGAVAVPELTKVKSALDKTGPAAKQAWAQLTPPERQLAGAIKSVETSFGRVSAALAPVVDQVVALGARTLKDAMPALQKLAGAGGQVLTAFLKPFDQFLKSKAFSQIIDQFAKFAVQAGNLVGPAVTQLLKLLLQLFVQLMPTGVQILKILLPLIVQIAADLAPAIVVLAKVTAAVLNWLVQTKLLKPVLLGLIPVIMLLVGSSGIGAILIAVGLLIAGIVELSKNWRKIWADIKQWARDAWDFLTHGWGQFLIPGLLVIRKEVEFVRDHWRDAWNAIKAVGEFFLNWYRGSLIARIVSGVRDIVSWFGNLRNNVNSLMSRLRSDISSTWNSIWANTVSRVANGINSVVSWFRGLPGKVVGAVGNVGRLLYQKGKDVIQGFLNGLTAIWHAVTSFISGIANWIKAHKGPISLDQNLLKPAGEAIMHGFLSGLKNKYKSVTSFISSVATGVGEGVSRWIPLIQQALKLEGLDSGLLRNVLVQMQSESGGNPRAINLWDANAARHDPSRGLMQVIGSTFQAYHWPGTSWDIYDPLANIAAALNYARHTYGPSLMSNGMGIGSGKGYAAGGPASGWAWVGEHGRELVKLPPGSHVYSNADSAGMAAGGGAVEVRLFIDPSFSKVGLSAEQVSAIKYEVRRLGGGDVQTAFGGRR